MMRKRWWVAIAVAVLVVTPILVVFTCLAVGIKVQITEDDINRELAKGLPYSESYLDIVTITYEDAAAKLTKGSDRATLMMAARVEAQVLEEIDVLRGSVVVTAGIRYEQNTGEFFMTDLEVVDVDIEGVPPGYKAIVTLVADVAVGTMMDLYPVYVLNPDDFETSIASLFLRDVRFEDGYLVVTLGL